MKLKHILLLSVLVLLSIFVSAQENEDKPKKGELYLTPLPILGANPTVGVIFGVAASAGYYFGEPETTRMSTAMSTVNYSTKDQLLSFIKTNIFLPNDKWVLQGDLRYFDSSQPTFGLGTGPQSAKLATGGNIEYDDNLFSAPIDQKQQLVFKFFRFHQNALIEMKDNYYLGAGYNLDYFYNIKDNLLDLDTTSGNIPTITSHLVYSYAHNISTEKYTTSGVSLVALFDSRDNSMTPYKGRFLNLEFFINPTLLGSEKNSTRLWLEYRDYFSVSKKHKQNLIAIWMFGNFVTSGTLPYLNLPATGWDKFGRSGRAYTQGRFRGENLIYNEAEYRMRLFGTKKNPNLFGAVAFVNATTASSELSNIKLYDYLDFGYGIGLRFMINKKSRINVTIDYAWGEYGASGFFLNATETF